MTVEVEARWITFPSAGAMVRGYLAHPLEGSAFGGVVCAPENLGVTEHRQRETRRLAGEGFVVLTVDPYSRIGGKPPQDYTTPEERRSKAFIAAKDETVVPDCQAALDWLWASGKVKGAIGALGYCLGGGTALAWAATSRDLACAVVLYALPVIPGAYTPDGRPRSRLDLGSKVECPLQLHFGDSDEAIPIEQTLALKARLEAESRYPVEFHIYEGARHAYMDDTIDRYSPTAAALTYQRFVAYLHRYLDAADG